MSSSVILMTMGIYDTYLNAISNVNISVLIPICIGLFIGGIIILKLIQYCINNYYSETYYSIIGFVIGSVFILLPDMYFSLNSVISVCFFIFGLLIGLKFESIK